MEDELDRVVRLDIYEPVSYSKWAAPIIPVLKPDGSVPIHGDKVTINLNANNYQYPLPRIENLFVTLHLMERRNFCEI